jgi:hypothetical protein
MQKNVKISYKFITDGVKPISNGFNAMPKSINNPHFLSDYLEAVL